MIRADFLGGFFVHIVVISVNYKTAPVEIREKVTFTNEGLISAMKQLKNQKSILENVIISTCNRTEVCAVVDQLHTGRYYIKTFLANWFGMDKDELAKWLVVYEADDAKEHLFRLACGLESMVLGETQILGQVRSSFLSAQEHQTVGTIFNQFFKQVITLAKKAHSETEIGANAVSVSYAAVELAKKVLGSLKDKQVLILGAGKMGELAVQNLYGSGAKNVVVMNRTFEKAEKLAERFSGGAKRLEELSCALVETDIIISSTGADGYVITKEMMESVEKMRKYRPLFMVDIAVPRDLDPKLAELDSVFLYDIDDLKDIVEANLAERQKAAIKIGEMIAGDIDDFNSWLYTLGVVPMISALRQKALAIQENTMESLEKKLPYLSERDHKVISKHMKSIVNQLIRDPILLAKELPSEKNADQALELFARIFNIEESLPLQEEKTLFNYTVNFKPLEV